MVSSHYSKPTSYPIWTPFDSYRASRRFHRVLISVVRTVRVRAIFAIFPNIKITIWNLLFKTTPYHFLGEPSKLSQAVIFRSPLTSLLEISAFISFKDIDYLLYHWPCSLSSCPSCLCQFSDKERVAIKALFIICPWKLSADFFELKKKQQKKKLVGKEKRH